MSLYTEMNPPSLARQRSPFATLPPTPDQNSLDVLDPGIKKALKKSVLDAKLFPAPVHRGYEQEGIDYTPEQRRTTPPWMTEDVPREDQIVSFRGDSNGDLLLEDLVQRLQQ